MSDRILKALPELIESGIISDETAEKIRAHYQSKKSAPGNTIIILFSIIGAILVGLGIILMIAHNWDNISRPVKTSLAFLPLISGQFICGFALLRKKNNVAWTEGSASFLFCAVGACISLVSQIYNIEGKLSSFLFTWMLLCLPLVYVMRSSMASLLYITGITCYASARGYFEYPESHTWCYWPLLLLIVPHVYLLFKNKRDSNFLLFHNWIIPISLIIVLGTIINDAEEFMMVTYMSLFGAFYLAGETIFAGNQKFFSNPWKLLGSLGTIVLLLITSFRWFWDELYDSDLPGELTSPEFLAALMLTLVACFFLYYSLKEKRFTVENPTAFVFLLFAVIFFLGFPYPLIATIAVNLITLAVGIYWLCNGAKTNHLGILNFGLLIITALATCRFFDVDMSFVLRGLLFVGVGGLFFVANMMTLRKRKPSTENHSL